MGLQSSGSISLANINTELGLVSSLMRSLGDVTTRTLLGKASGIIRLSDAYGKSNAAAPGQIEFAGNGGSYVTNWLCPVGVTSISIASIKKGGISSVSTTEYDNYFTAGAGGSLAYRNNIQVTPGKTYQVYVDAGEFFTSTEISNAFAHYGSGTITFAGGAGGGGLENIMGEGGRPGNFYGSGAAGSSYNATYPPPPPGNNLIGGIGTGPYGAGASQIIGPNGPGGLRIIWPGTTRQFPNMNITNV